MSTPLTEAQKESARAARRRWYLKNKAAFAEYQRNYRTTPSLHECGCGRPAVAYRLGGWVCETCKGIEQADEAREIRRRIVGVESVGGIEEYHLAMPELALAL